MINGYMWIPKDAPHPILAQIFIDWRLSDEVQFPPDSWGITHGAWAELNEGLLGESYADLIPDWFKADYFTYYPTIEQLTTTFKPVDWAYYSEHSSEWLTTTPRASASIVRSSDHRVRSAAVKGGSSGRWVARDEIRRSPR